MRNRITKERRLGIAILAIALAALLAITACASGPVVEEKTVEFGWVQPVTGGGAATSQILLTGWEDYVRYFNEQEAIPGVSIELLWRDTQLQTALGISHYESLVAAGIPLIAAGEPGLTAALKERCERDKVVGFLVGSPTHGDLYPDPGWYYVNIVPMFERAAVLLQYFMENWKEERPPRLAFMHVDHAVGYAVRYVTGYARDLGFEMLPPEVVPIVPLDTTVQLLRLKEGGADLVYIVHQSEGAGVILRDAERLGLLDQIQFAGPSLLMGDRTITLAGAAAEGFLSTRSYPWFDETEVPGIELVIDNMMEYHGKVSREGEYLTAWTGAAIVCEGIRRAIEDVGYENLGGPAIKEAFDGMKDFDVYGLCSITYKPDDHRGATKKAVYEVRGGKLVRVSDWREAPSGRDWVYE